MPNSQFNHKDYEISLKNKSNIKIFPGKQKLFVNGQISL